MSRQRFIRQLELEEAAENIADILRHEQQILDTDRPFGPCAD